MSAICPPVSPSIARSAPSSAPPPPPAPSRSRSAPRMPTAPPTPPSPSPFRPAPASGPVITSSTSATGRTGLRFSFQVITSGATSAARLSATNLPPGLTSTPSPASSPAQPPPMAASRVNLTVTDGAAVATGTLQLTFSSDPGRSRYHQPEQRHFSVRAAVQLHHLAPARRPRVIRPSSPSSALLPPGSVSIPPQARSRARSPASINRPRRASIPTSPAASSPTCSSSPPTPNGTTTIPLVFFLRPAGVANISTRLSVGADPRVLIGGFIVTGNAPKKVIIRAIAPSFSVNGVPVPGTLPDPTLELVGDRPLRHERRLARHPGTGNHRHHRRRRPTTASPPSSPCSIPATTPPSSAARTAPTGIGLVEVFDLGTASLDSGEQRQAGQHSAPAASSRPATTS